MDAFPKLEEKILKFWRNNKIFEKSLIKRARSQPFRFYEGPPFPNTPPALHSFLARAFKDNIHRYQTMRGRYVLRRAGWDVHGLPIELVLERELGLKSKKSIERYGIDRFNQAAEKKVWGHKAEWDAFTKRIGFWLDLSSAYITSSPAYIESIWWVLKQIWKKGLLEKDHKVVPWCWHCGTALSSHEVAQGYERVKDRALFLRFRVKARGKEWQNTAILSWTTTPWTLPGNVALAANPKEDYVCVPDPDMARHWLVLGFKSFQQLLARGLFPPEYRELSEPNIDVFKGKEMVGVEYEPLFPIRPLISKTSHRVLPADFVSMEEGTGVVHTAVMYGEDDFELGKKFKLPMHHTVDEGGRFTREVRKWGGKFVKDVEGNITEDLRSRGLVFKDELYEHDYPFCWRCDSPLLYYARDSWFIRMRKLRAKLIASNNTINWVPGYLREGRFGEFIREVKDWALSRERYWGTPLPVWQCQKCGAEQTIGSLAELTEKSFGPRTTLILLRHTGAEHNRRGIVSSWPERRKVHLTARGRKDAERLAIALRKKRPELIFSSDLTRTRETAAIIGKVLGRKVHLDKRLREVKAGILEGKRGTAYDKLYHRPFLQYNVAQRGGESLREVKRRMLAFALDMQQRYPGKTILMVSHGDPLRVLAAALLGFEDEYAAKDESLAFRLGEYRSMLIPNIPFDEEAQLNLHKPWVDRLYLRCPRCSRLRSPAFAKAMAGKKATAAKQGKMERVKEVIDVWFDSGAMPFAEWHYPFENREVIERGRHYPADFIAEGIDQTRGWFYTLLAVATALGKLAPYQNVLSLGLLLDEKGEKMSKSKGNVVDPWEMLSRYGADALRWYFYTVNPPAEPKRFSTREVEDRMRKFMALLWNSLQFYELYAPREQHSNILKNIRMLPPSSLSVLDRWLLARLRQTVNTMTRELDRYEIRAAALALEQLVDDLSHWYIRRSRSRFQRPKNQREAKEAQATLRFALVEIAKLAAPFTPFLTEEMYQRLGKAQESVHLEDWPKRVALNKEEKVLLERMKQVRTVASLVLRERAQAGIKVRQPLLKLKVRGQRSEGAPQLLELLMEEVNVKEIVFDQKLEKEVELDTTITSELREEGTIRELIRAIQDLRREAKLVPQDKIKLWVSAESKLTDVVTRNKKGLMREVNAKECTLGSAPQGYKIKRVVELEGTRIEITLRAIKG